MLDEMRCLAEIGRGRRGRPDICGAQMMDVSGRLVPSSCETPERELPTVLRRSEGAAGRGGEEGCEPRWRPTLAGWTLGETDRQWSRFACQLTGIRHACVESRGGRRKVASPPTRRALLAGAAGPDAQPRAEPRFANGHRRRS